MLSLWSFFGDGFDRCWWDIFSVWDFARVWINEMKEKGKKEKNQAQEEIRK